MQLFDYLRTTGPLCVLDYRAVLGLQSISEWPQRGGANGSIRFYPEIKHAANAGEAASRKAAVCLLAGFPWRSGNLVWIVLAVDDCSHGAVHLPAHGRAAKC